MARSMPLESRNLRKAFGERQYSTIWSKFGRFCFMSSSAWGLNISIGWMWIWQSVIMPVDVRRRAAFYQSGGYVAGQGTNDDQSIPLWNSSSGSKGVLKVKANWVGPCLCR